MKTHDQITLPPIYAIPRIHELRGERIILDSDLALMYGVSIQYLRATVKRNLNRFPVGGLFRLTAQEESDVSLGPRPTKVYNRQRFLPYAFTISGVIMAAFVLRSPIAIETSIFIVRSIGTMLNLLSPERSMGELLFDLKENSIIHGEVQGSEILQFLKKLIHSEGVTQRRVPPREGENELTLYRKLTTFYHHRWRMK